MKHYLKIAAAMIIWSTWGLMIRRLALPPVVVLCAASVIAGVAVPLILKLRGEFPPDLIVRGSVPLLAALVLSSLVNNLTYFYALGHTTVSNAVFTHYTAPIIVAALAPFVISERLQKVTKLSLPAAVAGMTLIVASSGGLRLASDDAWGILAGTTSGFAYAGVILVSRTLSRRLLHLRAIVVLLWSTAVMTAPFALRYEGTISVGQAVLLATAGILHSSVAPLLYFSALRRVLAQHAAILGYIEPLAAIPLAFLFLSETPPLTALAGGALILISGYLIVHFRERTGERE
jgi:drug/metabolite transporter (DMT)-like permease